MRACARWSVLLLPLIMMISPLVFADDDDDDDGGNSYRSKGVCDKACILRSLPPLTEGLYTTELPSPPKWEDVCATTVSVSCQPQDGFGGEVLARMSAEAGALEHGYTYVYTPFTVLDHVAGHEGDMESFVNLGADIIDIRQIQSNFVVQGKKDLDWGNPGAPGCSNIYAGVSTGPCRDGATPSNLMAYAPKVRRRYRLSPKPALPFEEGAYVVVVHYRRGDAGDRITPEAAVLNAINNVRTTVKGDGSTQGKLVKFHVFTQGTGCSQLEALADVTMHYDANTDQHGGSSPEMGPALRVAFHAMVMADALIATPSTLGYAAGVLSEGRVFAFPHDRPHLPDFTFLAGDGSFTPAEAAKSYKEPKSDKTNAASILSSWWNGSDGPAKTLSTSPTASPTTKPAASPNASPTASPTGAGAPAVEVKSPAVEASPAAEASLIASSVEASLDVDSASGSTTKAALLSSMGGVASAGVTGLMNMTSGLTSTIGSAVSQKLGNYSLNQTVGELNSAASAAMQDPKVFANSLVQGEQPVSVYGVIGGIVVLSVLIFCLVPSRAGKMKVEDGGADIEKAESKEKLLGSEMQNMPSSVTNISRKKVSAA